MRVLIALGLAPPELNPFRAFLLSTVAAGALPRTLFLHRGKA